MEKQHQYYFKPFHWTHIKINFLHCLCIQIFKASLLWSLKLLKRQQDRHTLRSLSAWVDRPILKKRNWALSHLDNDVLLSFSSQVFPWGALVLSAWLWEKKERNLLENVVWVSGKVESWLMNSNIAAGAGFKISSSQLPSS